MLRVSGKSLLATRLRNVTGNEFNCRPRNFRNLAASLTSTSVCTVRSIRSISRTLSSAAAAVTSSSSLETHGHNLPITSVDEERVVVMWDTDIWSRFHNIYLRDHCPCPQCLHSQTKQRLLNTFEIPSDIRPIKVESRAEGLAILWTADGHGNKGHESIYPWEWLKRYSYDPIIPSKKVTEKVLWNSRILESPPTVSYEEIVKDGEEGEKGVFKWLSNIDRFGFSFISSVPPTTSATEYLIRRISFIRETHYGAFWEFTSDLAKGDTAYTNIALEAHTDNSYFTDPCGLELFHLLEHSPSESSSGTADTSLGGQTLLIDGFYIASILRTLHPSSYRLLSTMPIPSHASGDKDGAGIFSTEDVGGYPVLTHDMTGELVQVRWNNSDRGALNPSVLSSITGSKTTSASFRGQELYSVPEIYSALRTFHSLLSSPESRYLVQLKPGTAVIVDNHRVLHGRTEFTGKRRMCGAYLGRDEWRAKLTGLRARGFGNNEGT